MNLQGMSEFIGYLGYLTMTLLLYAPPFWARWGFSGDNYSEWKLALVFYYNGACAFFHIYFIQTGAILFYGPMDNSVLGWVSMVMVGVHVRTRPAPWIRPRWFVRKKFDPRIRKLK